MTKKSGSSKRHLIISLAQKVVIGVCSVGLASAVGYLMSDLLIDTLYDSLPGQISVATPNSHMIIIICLAFGLILSAPIIVWLTMSFIQSKSQNESAGRTALAVLASAGLMVCGVALAYFVLLPSALQAFVNIQKATSGNLIVPGGEYLGFIMAYLVGFAVIFQTPVVLFILRQVKKARLTSLLKFERYVLLASFIVAGLLTPTTDVAHQAVLAAPIIASYQIGVLWAWLAGKRQKPAVSELKLVPPFTLNIPDEALLAEFNNKLAPAAATAAKLVPKPAATISKAQAKKPKPQQSKPPARYQGVGYARQPISYQTRPNRHLISDVTAV